MQERTEGNSPSKRPIVVIGGGAAGLMTALKFANQGYQVELIEKNTLGQGASGRNPGRMGHGFHYTDVKTALAYLEASIGVQKKYPNYLIGDVGSRLRHGRYFITKNSDTDADTILKTYEAIKQHYKELVAQDPSNEVFGPPESFYRILNPNEYEKDVGTFSEEECKAAIGKFAGKLIPGECRVAKGVETNEALFNWQAFLKDRREEIEKHPNIKLREHTEVIDLKRNKDRKSLQDARFIVDIKTENGTEQIATDEIMNSAWENIEYLNAKLGIPMKENARTNRPKALLEFTLPEPYASELPCMFFCMGKFCMISNMGNGTFLATAAEETNLGFEWGLTLSAESQRLVDGKATEEERKALGQKMLKIITSYVPAVAHAEYKDVKFGIVRTQGKLTFEGLSDPNDPFRQRADHCVKEEQQGLISNPLMKLFYFLENAELVCNLLETQEKATEVIAVCFNQLQQHAQEQHLPFDSTTVLEKLDQYPSHELTRENIPKIVNQLMAAKNPSIAPCPQGFFQAENTTNTHTSSTTGIKGPT